MTSLPDITRTGRGVVALLLMRTVLLFVGTGVVLPFVGWIYNRALLWADVTVVIVDVITLLVLSRLLAPPGRGPPGAGHRPESRGPGAGRRRRAHR